MPEPQLENPPISTPNQDRLITFKVSTKTLVGLAWGVLTVIALVQTVQLVQLQQAVRGAANTPALSRTASPSPSSSTTNTAPSSGNSLPNMVGGC